jgi:LysM repeat protein
MVSMVSERPIVTVNHGRVTADEWPIRTRETLPPARLARRRRMLVTAVSALLIGVLSVALATTAQATHAGSASPASYITKVTVLPGQSLWSLAEAYDPDADTRVVIQEIQQANSMTGDQVQPGEVLWVPRGLAVGGPGAQAAR